jgi:hypothetical protein
MLVVRTTPQRWLSKTILVCDHWLQKTAGGFSFRRQFYFDLSLRLCVEPVLATLMLDFNAETQRTQRQRDLLIVPLQF